MKEAEKNRELEIQKAETDNHPTESCTNVLIFYSDELH